MALLHRAELRPSKIEITTAWVRTQPWFEGEATAEFEQVGAFRFDDPEGRVGIETLLVKVADGPVLQVPLTYRDAPLEGGEDWLIGTLEHSVLGTRHVYDAVGDPAYLRAIATAALGGGSQADQYYEVDGERVFRDPSAIVTGSGTPGARPVDELLPGSVTTHDEGAVSVATVGDLRVAVARVPGIGSPADALTGAIGAATEREVVSGTWQQRDEPVTLAVVVRD